MRADSFAFCAGLTPDFSFAGTFLTAGFFAFLAGFWTAGFFDVLSETLIFQIRVLIIRDELSLKSLKKRRFISENLCWPVHFHIERTAKDSEGEKNRPLDHNDSPLGTVYLTF